MLPAPISDNEPERLAALQQYQILDTKPESELDDLVTLAAQIFNTPMALISLIDANRQWFLSKVGVTATETPRDISFCGHAIVQPDVFVIQDAQADDRFATNPLVTGDPYIRFYAGAPLVTPEGHALGTLCILDRRPRELSRDQRNALRILGRQVAVRMQLRLLLGEREQTIARLQELELLRDNLTDMIVHDLRSPLFGITGYLQLVTMQSGARIGAEDLDNINRALHQTSTLVEMISSLLDVNRLEAGKMPLQIDPCDMATIVQEGIAVLGSIPGQCPVMCELPREPVSVSCDKSVMLRVIQNLVGNAVKFTPGEGNVRVAFVKDGAHVRVTVADTGQPIPPEYHETIFKKFGQAGIRKRGERASTGLGLTFCKLAVEAHGGRIGIESAAGKGNTFWFVLPVEPQTEAQPFNGKGV